MNATEIIIAAITDALATSDAEDLVKDIADMRDRKERTMAYIASRDCLVDTDNPNAKLRAKLLSICGSEKMIDFIRHAKDEKIVAFCIKNSEARVAKRNAKIAKDLAKIGVTSIESAEVTVNHNGFDGVYRVVTDKGVKSVRIYTILAGGYNVQCLHTRVLVSVN